MFTLFIRFVSFFLIKKITFFVFYKSKFLIYICMYMYVCIFFSFLVQ